MEGYIRKAKDWEKKFGRWVVGSKRSIGVDITNSLPTAIRYWLWHSGVHPKIAFFNFKYLWKNN